MGVSVRARARRTGMLAFARHKLVVDTATAGVAAAHRTPQEGGARTAAVERATDAPHGLIFLRSYAAATAPPYYPLVFLPVVINYPDKVAGWTCAACTPPYLRPHLVALEARWGARVALPHLRERCAGACAQTLEEVIRDAAVAAAADADAG